jgi:hypothetical protein
MTEKEQRKGQFISAALFGMLRSKLRVVWKKEHFVVYYRLSSVNLKQI